MLDEVVLALFMVEAGFLARWLPFVPATFRADFFLRTFTVKKMRQRQTASKAVRPAPQMAPRTVPLLVSDLPCETFGPGTSKIVAL